MHEPAGFQIRMHVIVRQLAFDYAYKEFIRKPIGFVGYEEP